MASSMVAKGTQKAEDCWQVTSKCVERRFTLTCKAAPELYLDHRERFLAYEYGVSWW